MKDRFSSPLRLMMSAIAFAVAVSAGAAEAADVDAARIGELERRLESLQQEVNELSNARSPKSADEGLTLRGFADVGGIHSTARGGKKGLTVGSLDFYLTPQFGQMKTVLELVFEVEHEGSVLADLERAQIGYTFSDALTAWVGRFHTPYGYWNTAFHHGMQIQTSATRPRFLDFDDMGGILPAHSVGVWFTGGQGLSGSRIGYDLYVANAPQIALDDPSKTLPDTVGSLDSKMAGGQTSDMVLGLNVSLRPAGLADLLLGVHAYRGEVSDTMATPNRTRVNMTGGYAVFDDHRWELMTEYYRFRDEDLSGGTGKHASSAWFAQAGFAMDAFMPYGRFEQTRLAQTDNFFLAQESGRPYRRAVAGLRYNVTPKAAVKVEFSRTEQDDQASGDENYNESRFQLAVRF